VTKIAGRKIEYMGERDQFAVYHLEQDPQSGEVKGTELTRGDAGLPSIATRKSADSPTQRFFLAKVDIDDEDQLDQVSQEFYDWVQSRRT